MLTVLESSEVLQDYQPLEPLPEQAKAPGQFEADQQAEQACQCPELLDGLRRIQHERASILTVANAVLEAAGSAEMLSEQEFQLLQTQIAQLINLHRRSSQLLGLGPKLPD
ncbi:MAG TPA: hypothetical protein VH186_15735 [Chloroflexia bacterium]|nr:hypothetical protein [Chloroflexia bacterium]